MATKDHENNENAIALLIPAILFSLSLMLHPAATLTPFVQRPVFAIIGNSFIQPESHSAGIHATQQLIVLKEERLAYTNT